MYSPIFLLQVSSPSCDSQGLQAEEAPTSNPEPRHSNRCAGLAVRRLLPYPSPRVAGEDRAAGQPIRSLALFGGVHPVAKRLWEGSSSRDGGGGAQVEVGPGSRPLSQDSVRGSAIQSSGALAMAMGMGASGAGIGSGVGGHGSGSNGSVVSMGNVASEGAKPGHDERLTSDSPISYHDEEEEEEVTEEQTEEQYRQICNMYTMYSMLNVGAAAGERVEALPDHSETRGRMRGRQTCRLSPLSSSHR
nr:nucleus accumbens-associated protein 1-like [Salvelinus alpinus]